MMRTRQCFSLGSFLKKASIAQGGKRAGLSNAATCFHFFLLLKFLLLALLHHP